MLYPFIDRGVRYMKKGANFCNFIKKELNSPYSLNKISQILSAGVLEKISIIQAFTNIDLPENTTNVPKQLILFDS